MWPATASAHRPRAARAPAAGEMPFIHLLGNTPMERLAPPFFDPVGGLAYSMCGFLLKEALVYRVSQIPAKESNLFKSREVKCLGRPFPSLGGRPDGHRCVRDILRYSNGGLDRTAGNSASW